VVRLLWWSTRPGRDERPDHPFTGYKLAHAALSADGARTGFAGLTMGAGQVYGVVAEASCVWNSHHAPPRRWCGCGFYCLHALTDALALGCATENRSALLIEVAASGRYIRYERGLRYSRQRVRAIRQAGCACGRPGTALADAGSGLVGWRRLTPVCDLCATGRPVMTLGEFAARLDGRIRVDAGQDALAQSDVGSAPPPAVPRPAVPLPAVPLQATGEPPYAVLAAEIALLHARLDDLQGRLEG
jgi:hypothetical protein